MKLEDIQVGMVYSLPVVVSRKDEMYVHGFPLAEVFHGQCTPCRDKERFALHPSLLANAPLLCKGGATMMNIRYRLRDCLLREVYEDERMRKALCERSDHGFVRDLVKIATDRACGIIMYCELGLDGESGILVDEGIIPRKGKGGEV